jgi:hypothetical protein
MIPPDPVTGPIPERAVRIAARKLDLWSDDTLRETIDAMDMARKQLQAVVQSGELVPRDRVARLEEALEDLIDRQNDYPTDLSGPGADREWREAFHRARQALDPTGETK